jgi:LysR family glycine cleavage system transcriptional activator
LNALRAFEAAARNLSVTKASAELHVTHAAVSQQIKLLEDYFGFSLIRREGKGINLTAQGKMYASELTTAFSNISHATSHLFNQDNSNILTIRIPTTLALRWFIPRMQHFQNQHPNMELRISTTQKEINFDEGNIDVAIYYGENHWPGLHKDFLFEDYLLPVCSPKILFKKNVLENLNSYKFIYVSAELRKQDWPIWFKAAKIPEPPKSSRLYFQDTVQALQAAHAGLGIAIAHEPFVKDDIQSKQLVSPWNVTVKLQDDYYLIFPESSLGKSKIKKFRKWLLDEAKK